MIKRGSMRPSSILPYIEALVKKFFFDLIFSSYSASSKTSKSKFLAHSSLSVESCEANTECDFNEFLEQKTFFMLSFLLSA